jgi:bifunctional ADP-heptose synthase (sugar kinase/adenylyltransferase)
MRRRGGRVGDLTPEICLSKLKPDIHCKGADYAPPHGKPLPEAELVESYGGTVRFIPLSPETSTTKITERIRLAL